MTDFASNSTWYDLEYEPYQFYYFAVAQGEDGLYISTDSGCSCPMPFESHTNDDFTGPLTLEQVIEEYTSLANVDGQYAPITVEQRDENIARIRKEFA
jgi:hypothetical protein